MTRVAIATSSAPKAIGPYSQAIKKGDWLFTSGQIALDPTTGALVSDDVRAQTEQVMANLEAVLKAAGATFEHVLKATIFLKDFNDFATVNEVYGKRFEGMDPPARSTVEVARLPRDVKVEIELVAHLG